MIDAAIWKVSAPVPVRERPPKPERVITSSPDIDRLRQALAAIPNDDVPYNDWFRIACGVHHATDGEGLEVFREWSARSAKHDDDFLESRVWPYIQVERGGDVITADYILKTAERHGWQDPAVMDDFDALPADPVDNPRKVNRFQVLHEDEFLDAPPVSWLVKGVLPHAEMAVMYGESASGKSFMAFDIAAAIARGVEWRGRKVKRGRVVYIAAEGAAGFRNRMRAYRHQHNIPSTGVEVLPTAPNLIDKNEAIEVAKAILVRGGADLVVVDTLAQSMQGNENSGEDMGKFLAHCKGIHRATGAMVLLIHHAGKDSAKGARGWSGLRAAADAEMEVVRADDDRVLTVTKQKDGDDGAEFGFKLDTVLVDFDMDGDDVTSCVVSHCEASNLRDRKKLKGANQKIVLRMFDELEGLDGEGVDRAALKAAVVSEIEFDAAAGKKDRRGELADKAIESVRDAGFFFAEGARLKRAIAQ